MVRLTRNNNTTFDLPATLILTTELGEKNYEMHSAAYSNKIVLSGDGLPKEKELNVEGTAYFANTTAAHTFLATLKTFCDDLKNIIVDNNTFTCSAGGYVAVPVMLPRTLKMKITFYPNSNTNL